MLQKHDSTTLVCKRDMHAGPDFPPLDYNSAIGFIVWMAALRLINSLIIRAIQRFYTAICGLLVASYDTQQYRMPIYVLSLVPRTVYNIYEP